MPTAPKILLTAERLVAPDLPDHERIRALAAALPDGAAVSRRTAAHLWGFHLTMPDERGARLLLECTIPRGRERVRRPGVRSYTSALFGDVVELDGIPVTSIDRTILDIARYAFPPLALAMLDRALALELFDPEVLLGRLDRLTGERGVAQARRLISLADAGAESPAESWTRLRFADAGFPPLRTQIPVPRPGRRRPYRLDMGWEAKKVAVEYDGREGHSTQRDRVHDAERRAWLASIGWTIIVVNLGDVLGRSTAMEHGVADVLGLPLEIRPRRW